MRKIHNGKLYVTIEKYSSNTCCGGKRDRLFKKLLTIGKYKLVIREKDITGLNSFGNKRFNDFLSTNNITKEAFSVSDILNMPFLLNGDTWKLTERCGVVFNETKQKYYGFTHRGGCMFGIGDMLFDIDHENIYKYYENKKLRWKLIKTILQYHFKNDTFMFQDIFEDNCIGHGIKTIVPFKQRGSKVIETLEEAKQAAINMSEYLN